jgi:hypothetical protein
MSIPSSQRQTYVNLNKFWNRACYLTGYREMLDIECMFVKFFLNIFFTAFNLFNLGGEVRHGRLVV